tara:strand:- start:528 stop:788 length:261 start_codon:yes stop_codon:yes gene_type:complete
MKAMTTKILTNELDDVSADDVQHGGSHYKDMAIQPWAVMEVVLTHAEFVGFLKGNIIKYSLRQGKKDSPDADKARHYMQKLKETIG